ncbi:hypothetical protein [Candidatus Nitrosotenuis uzonensis]|uniref:Uncharacterized protein n=1 Tax=Candidatus Nitrosotenuis uzonensis TaxID=1407055 RepID=V6AUN8_9ARCH|nr:hypothetical protein [Candidatus Nitrosotenuis uzonensis]CDI06591.1 exported hypothetical protein [Candidatus Nitrosotenuis uzonensis]
MRSKLFSAILLVLVGSMMVGYEQVFADAYLDSLVNLATQARAQIKIQLDRMNSVSAEVKELYAKGDAETDLLVAAANQNNTSEAKQRFMSAMKIFRQISQTFSEPAPAQKAVPAADTSMMTATTQQVSEATYRNNLVRTEKYIDTLRTTVIRNSLTVDFAKADELIQNAKSSLAAGNFAEVDRMLGELKAEQNRIQREIKEQTIQQSNARVKAFVNEYIAQIDAILLQAKELGLSDVDIAKLTKIKEELVSTRDASQLIIKIKHYSVNISISDYKSQKIQSEIAKLEGRLMGLERSIDGSVKTKFDAARQLLTQIKNQTASEDTLEKLALIDSAVREIESYVQSKSRENKAEIQPVPEQKETKNPRLEEIMRLEERLVQLESKVDSSMKPKLDTAKALLNKIKSQTASGDPSFTRTAKALEMLIGDMEDSLKHSEEKAKPAEERAANLKRSSEKKE